MGDLIVFDPRVGSTGDDVYNVPGGHKLDGSLDTSLGTIMRAGSSAGFSPSTNPSLVQCASSKHLNQVIGLINHQLTALSLPTMSYVNTGDKISGATWALCKTKIDAIRSGNGYSAFSWSSIWSGSLVAKKILGSHLAELRKALNVPAATVLITSLPSGSTAYITSTNPTTWAAGVGTITSSLWRSIAYSPTQNIFVAISTSGLLMTSPDGGVTTAWTLRSIPQANTWECVCWSPDALLFVATSNNGTNRVMTSADGINWFIATAATADLWSAVCWSHAQSLFVACAGRSSPAHSGALTKVMVSSTGTGTWTSKNVTVDSLTVRRVCYADAPINAFVAVGVGALSTDPFAMTSPTGSTWTFGPVIAGLSLTSCCYSPSLGLVCAVGAGGTVYTYDGTTWTPQATFPDATAALTDVCWSPTLVKFIACSSAGTNRIFTSPDGVTWTPQTTPSSLIQQSVCVNV